jgi:hypothetical protein
MAGLIEQTLAELAQQNQGAPRAPKPEGDSSADDWKLFANPPSANSDGGWNLHDFLTGKGGLIRSGLEQTAKGIQEFVATPERDARLRAMGYAPQIPPTSKWTAAHDIASGLATAASPVAIGATLAAAPLAPLATATTVAAGAVGAGAGGYAGQKIAEAAGGGPEAQQFGSDVGALGGGLLAGSTAQRLGEWIAALNPKVTSAKLYKPPPSDTGFPEVSPEALSDLKRYGTQMPQSKVGKASKLVGQITGGGGYERPMVSMENVRVGSPQIETAIKNMQGGLDEYLDLARKRGVQIPGDGLVSATKKAIPDLMWTRDPNGAQALVDEAQQAFGGKSFTPDQFRDWLKTENGTLRSFYNRSAPVQGAAQMAGTPTAIEEAQANAIRENLYQHIDPENNGDGPRELQKRTGNLYKLRDASERLSNRALNEKPDSVGGGFANVFKAFNLLRGNVAEAGGALNPWRGPTDAKLTELYRQIPLGRDLPSPQITAPRALLGPAPITTPPPVDTSSFNVTTGPPVTGPANRALPPPTIKAGSTPDTSGATGWAPYPGSGISPDSGLRTLGEGPTVTSQATGEVQPQTPQNPTDFALGSQHGDITDTMPQRNPTTGEVVHIPRPPKVPIAKILGKSITTRPPEFPLSQ